MRRRALLTTIAGFGLASGCLSPFTDDSVALRIENATVSSLTVDLVLGGTIVPDGATPPENETLTPLGRSEVTFERTIELDPRESQRFGGVLTYTDGPRNTGLTIDVEGRPRRRVPLLDLHTNRNLILVTLREDGIDVTVRGK
jgi:hypothetical protein